MISLSIYTGHNASACVMKDGEILLNWELERFTRIKHDYGYNQAFIDKTLDHCELTMDDIDVVLINREPWEGSLRQPPWKVPSVVEKDSVKFTINGKEAHVINHHLCHVASSYYTSRFSTATIITYDAGGDYSRFSYAEARENKITFFRAQLTAYGSSVIDNTSAKNVAGWWSGLTMNNYRMPRIHEVDPGSGCLLYTSPSPRDGLLSRMPSSA